jgi:hypothetical protein
MPSASFIRIRRTLSRSLVVAAGAFSLLGPATASAHCIDFDGNRVCAEHDDKEVNLPPVRGQPVDTSTGTYHAPPLPPPSERKEDKRDEPPPPPKAPERKYVKH